MKIRQLFDPDSSTYTYLVWDARSQEAALIDPVQPQVGRDIRLVRQLGLKLKYTLETHIHADHITGAGAIRNILNSIVLVHENSRTKCADVLVKDGDFVPLGTQKIHIIHTPGHTDGDVCYLADNTVFTGDTLLIKGCGRTDFQSGDAGTLYDSITRQLFTLPGETRVYPGHDYNGRTHSTIAEEHLNNPRINKRIGRDEFITMMSTLDLAPPRQIHEAWPSNMRCGTPDYSPVTLAGCTL
ncbi:MAG TPA: MBL fold metallo-hydrolase [Gammaproteobacteria bacterium]|nr:MBL fold metallo-hydrolase [Gammaproteobacteria bacterium]